MLTLGALDAVAPSSTPCSVPSDATTPGSKICLPESDRLPDFYRNSIFFGRGSRIGTKSVRLEIRSWATHKIVTRLAEILLRERMGLEVVVQQFSRDESCLEESPGRHVYERLANGTVRAMHAEPLVAFHFNASSSHAHPTRTPAQVDLNFELWPANFMSSRSAALKEATTYVVLRSAPPRRS